MRASTIKLVGVICVALTVLITLIAFVPTYSLPTEPAADADAEVKYSYDKVKNASDAANFLAQFGWVTEETPIEEKTVTIPTEFDKIFAAYNELQKSQGLNLAKYRGKDVTRYTFVIKKYEGYEGTVWANVLVWRGRVIGGDICSADVSGFVHGFEKK
jgi:hypothetical protein